jgi:cysteine desulfurase
VGPPRGAFGTAGRSFEGCLAKLGSERAAPKPSFVPVMPPAYLDHAAATPLRPEVIDAIAPVLDRIIGNPSSLHGWGRAARRLVEEARERCAALLRAAPRELHFVRGGTEANNLALLGRWEWAEANNVSEPRFLRSSIEHPSVIEPLEAIESRGARVEAIPVSLTGALTFPTADSLRGSPPVLASIQWVNQETGMVLPISEAASALGASGVPLHVDAIQAVGRVEVDFAASGAALLSVSGHKLGAPPGTGLLLRREGTQLLPRLFGGGQEGALRPGTEDVAGAVGLAAALELAVGGREEEAVRLGGLRDRLEEGLRGAVPGIRVHGEDALRAPHILGIGIPGIPHDVLPGALDLEGIGVSGGSACRSGSQAPSHVLAALYGPEAGEFAPLRISLGWSTGREEIDSALRLIPRVVERIREAGVGG